MSIIQQCSQNPGELYFKGSRPISTSLVSEFSCHLIMALSQTRRKGMYRGSVFQLGVPVCGTEWGGGSVDVRSQLSQAGIVKLLSDGWPSEHCSQLLFLPVTFIYFTLFFNTELSMHSNISTYFFHTFWVKNCPKGKRTHLNGSICYNVGDLQQSYSAIQLVHVSANWLSHRPGSPGFRKTHSGATTICRSVNRCKVMRTDVYWCVDRYGQSCSKLCATWTAVGSLWCQGARFLWWSAASPAG